MARTIALVALVVAIGVAVAWGAWAVAVGLATSGAVGLGLVGRRVTTVLRRRPARFVPGTGAVVIMAALGVGPSIVIGALCAVGTATYWWLGFPTGWFLGFGVSLVAVWATVIHGLRAQRRTPPP